MLQRSTLIAVFNSYRIGALLSLKPGFPAQDRTAVSTIRSFSPKPIAVWWAVRTINHILRVRNPHHKSDTQIIRKVRNAHPTIV
ncbi:MAG: hypothetical protein EAZ69_04925 [Oscillatoriales cyanobacterium]|nr:MAG: hypothetical protein EAZ69_04925 [Oscillatoriales cyanobacterium]